jgi:hypothetical protein
MSVIGDIYISDSYFRQLFEFVIIATVIYRSYVVTPLPRNNKYLKDHLVTTTERDQTRTRKDPAVDPVQFTSHLTIGITHTLEVTSGW